jgi:hypothetical protein
MQYNSMHAHFRLISAQGLDFGQRLQPRPADPVANLPRAQRARLRLLRYPSLGLTPRDVLHVCSIDDVA